MIITERDEKIREFLLEVTVADTKSLSILFFNGSLRACQNRLKKLVDIKYIKCFREGIPGQNIFYIGRKPKSWKHKIVFSQLLGVLQLNEIKILKYRTPLKICNVIADGFIAINENGINKIYLIEVERTKNFNVNKYIDLYYSRKWKDLFPIFPSILVITDKKIEVNDKLNIKKCKLDLSDLKI